MPHGDFSDYAAYFMLGTSVAVLSYPKLFYMGAGPLKPMFDGEPTEDALAAIQFAAGPMFFMGPVLFVVRWNTLNGKAAATGTLVMAINTALIALRMDGFEFVLRGWCACPFPTSCHRSSPLAGFSSFSILQVHPFGGHDCRDAAPRIQCESNADLGSAVGEGASQEEQGKCQGQVNITSTRAFISMRTRSHQMVNSCLRSCAQGGSQPLI